MSLADVDALHAVAGEWTGERQLVEHADLEAFSQLTGRLCVALGESAEEGFWGPVVRMLKRARWDAATTPLPLSSSATGLAEAARDAVPRLMKCRGVAPELAAAAEDLADRLNALAVNDDDPIGDAVRGALSSRLATASDNEADKTMNAVLIRIGRYFAEVQAAFSGVSSRMSVLTPSEFIAASPLDLVAVVGPSAWFPASVVRAPRARRMVFVYPSWIQDPEPQIELLARGSRRSAKSRISRAPERGVASFDGALPVTPAEEWIPKADWQAISAAGGRRPGDDAASDPVDAWLFALASGEGVFLEASEGSRAYVIELEDDLSIHQESTSQIDKGDFVVLRTGGEGDYIRAIADSILGNKWHALREMQADWKQGLARAIADVGSHGLREALEAAGAVRATDNNIRAWLRPDSIRTRDPADFLAITTVIGAQDRFRELWDGMGAIDSAHRRAGMQVRALLIREILRSDRSLLVSQGWADFDVEEIEGEGTLRVARVDARAPEPQRIPRTRTRRPFPIGRDLWLE